MEWTDCHCSGSRYLVLLLPKGTQDCPDLRYNLHVFEGYIKPYMEKFCSKVTLDELCHMIEQGQDVYPLWLEDFSNEEKPPWFAYFLEAQIKAEVREVLAEISPEHFRVFDLNPAWANRQLEGLLEELFR
ncbi:hypothetical protein ES703_15758 [subsurface metagenome]